MKIILEEAMGAYVLEMNRITDLIRDIQSKAVNAAYRGDNINYQKHSKEISELGNELVQRSNELEVIKAAYAAI